MNSLFTIVRTEKKTFSTGGNQERFAKRTGGRTFSTDGNQIRKEVSLLHRVLKGSLSQMSEETCHPKERSRCIGEVADQCLTIKEIEGRITKLMQDELVINALTADDKALNAYGPKHKNLVKLRKLVRCIQFPGVEKPPKPHGVRSKQVQSFLKKQAPEIMEHWQALGELYKGYSKETPFLEEPEAAEHLKAIDQAIKAVFAKAGAEKETFEALGLSEKLIAWLDEIKASGNYLMVRSSGSEDSRKTANAGGNASPSYVPPERKEFCEALGEVVRSYFGYASLQNRLSTDENPFDVIFESLELAVTSQELIGETVGGAKELSQVPISLVLFSNEPLYVGGEKFRVMRISATYGHGEGVVGNQGIASDTVLVLNSLAHPDQLHVLYDNQEKPERLGPIRDPETGKVSLQKIRNPESWSSRRVLDAGLLTRLYALGFVSEKFFDNIPTDMEIVVKGDKIYPVQARPINRPEMLPTYLDLQKIGKKSLIEETVQAEMLVPGRASVVTVNSSKEIIFPNTLEEAERAYPKGKYKLVVVKTPEPANSHPIVNFSNLGVPCLYSRDEKAAQELINRIVDDHPLVACMQAATLNLWNRKEGEPEEFVSKGFAVHPAKVAISLPLSMKLTKVPTQVEVPQEVKNLVLHVRAAKTNKVAMKHLTALRKHRWVRQVKEREERLKQRLKKTKFRVQSAENAAKALSQLARWLEMAFEENKAALEREEGEGHLERLFYAKEIKTLLFAPPTADGGLSQYSVLNIEPVYTAAATIIDYQEKLPFSAHFADLLVDGYASPFEGVTDDWKQFLLQLEPLAEGALQGKNTGISKEEVSRFKEMMTTLRSTGVLPIWTTFFFEEARKETAQATLKVLLSSLNASDKQLIKQMLGRGERVTEHTQSHRSIC